MLTDNLLRPRRVLAFDTSIAHCGWAILEETVVSAPPRYVGSFCHETDTSTPDPDRVTRLGRYAVILIQTYQPTHIIVEQPLPWAGRGFLGKRNLIKQGMAYGALCLVGMTSGLPFETHSPTMWKGKSPKEKHVEAFRSIVHRQPHSHDEAEAFSYAWWYLTGLNAAGVRS
jgi:Holliday junction resolvasome RuvABC endonuclease subunit